MIYRKDIDGLRSVAILPVVLFHAGLQSVSGGYVGVDIFFVISGFLITSVIMAALNKGTFSFRHFYERRARRLLPALFAVLLFCLFAGYFIMSPVQYQDMGSAFVATVFYITNILMWSRSGYFQSSSEYDPLLHMWSLSVEEQFYIFYPILLLIIVRFIKQSPLLLVGLICLASFGISVWGVNNMPNPTFFWLPTRVWELGLGAMVALSLVGLHWKRPLRDIVGIIGLVLIGCSIFLYSPSTSFPGIAAIPPVLGTALIIIAGRGGRNVIGRILSWKPLIGIGLISYSLYLWHWPIFVFLNIHFGLHSVPFYATISGLVLSFIIATFSWKFVEQPFRSSNGYTRKQIFSFSGVGILAFTIIGGVIWSAKGFEKRFDDRTNSAFRAAEGNPYRERCLSRHLSEALCELGTSGEVHSFVLWGDSHAMSAAHGFDLAAKARKSNGYLASHSDCPPVLGVSGSPVHNGKSCERFRNDIIDHIINEASLKTVILHARWARYSEPALSWEVGSPPMFNLLDKGMLPLTGDVYSRNYIDEGLLTLIEKLTENGKSVYVVQTVPEQYFPVAYTVGRSLGFGTNLPSAISKSHASRRDEIFKRLERKLDKMGVIRYSVLDKFCAENCIYVKDNKPLYEDDNHLSLYGSEVAFADFSFEQGPK